MWWPLKKRSQFQHKTKKKWKSMILGLLQHGHILLWFCKKKYAYQQKYTFLKDLVKHSLVALRIFEKDCLSTSWAVLSFPLDKGPGRKKTNINIRLQYDYLLTLIGAFTCMWVFLLENSVANLPIILEVIWHHCFCSKHFENISCWFF